MFFIYLVFPLLALYVLSAASKKKLWLFSVQNILLSLGIFLLSVSSMILTQYRLSRLGIFSVDSFLKPVSFGNSFSSRFSNIWSVYTRKMETLWPLTDSGLSTLVMAMVLVKIMTAT